MCKTDRIVVQLLMDLAGRRGFDNVLDSIDDGIKEEIVQKWKDIINYVLNND